ncbi:MAG: T9SS type B sorting domain-containing protein, partial [Cytophagales bacterium]|nr:T9SS type B sorting domain-containing protein [Cytophagales bacterium]
TVASATETISGIDVSGLTDGTLTLSVTLTDPAGNAGSAATDTETKDTAPPSGFTVSIDQSPVNSQNEDGVSFSFASAETGSTFSYTISSSNGGSDVTGTGTIASVNQTVSNIDVSGLGDGVLTLSVVLTDTNGNPSSSVTDTEIKDSTAPTGFSVSIDQNAITPGNQHVVSFTFTGAESGATYNYTFSSSGGNATVTNTGTAGTSNSTIIGIDLTSLADGTVTLEVTLTDFNGNTSLPATTTKIKDTTAPTAISQNLTVQLDDAGNSTITASQVDNGSSDLYGIASMSLDTESFDCSDIGANTVNLTVTDNHGNTASAAATITVEDRLAASLTCPDSIQVQALPSEIPVQIVFGKPAAVDNCGGTLQFSNSYTQSSDTTAGFQMGDTTIMWTVTDSNGNTSSCGTHVEVINREVPLTIQPIGVLQVNEHDTLNYQVQVDNPSESQLVYQLSSNATDLGMTISSDGNIQWVPSEAQAPFNYTLQVTVASQFNPELSSSATFSVMTHEVNSPHTIQSLSDVVMDEHDTMTVSIQVSDADIPAQSFTYEIDAEHADLGMTMNSNTGQMSWTPGEDHGDSTYQVRFWVSDDAPTPIRKSVVMSIQVNETMSAIVVENGEDQPVEQNMDVGDSSAAFTFTIVDPEGRDIEPTVQLETNPQNVVSESDFELIRDGDEYSLEVNIIDKEFVGRVQIRVLIDDGLPASNSRTGKTKTVYELVYYITLEPRVLPLDIPTLLTPNGDGFNDTWNILYLSLYNSNTVQVFDQFGNRVFYKENYSRQDEWDGTYNGKVLPTGPYTFKIEVDGTKYKGVLNIIR